MKFIRTYSSEDKSFERWLNLSGSWYETTLSLTIPRSRVRNYKSYTKDSSFSLISSYCRSTYHADQEKNVSIS